MPYTMPFLIIVCVLRFVEQTDRDLVERGTVMARQPASKQRRVITRFRSLLWMVCAIRKELCSRTGLYSFCLRE